MSVGFLVIATLAILLALGAIIGVMMLVAARGSSQERDTRVADTSAPVMAVTSEPGEQVASLAAEQIEQMARARLAAYPDLANITLDFGTMPDGTIDVWVDGEQYDDPQNVPDARIRAAIADAVAEFNAHGT
jgi:hypothetical protein